MVSDVTETAVPDVLTRSMSPAAVSAETKKAARLRAALLPIPVVAFRSTLLAVIRLVPSISPPVAVSVTVLLVAVIGFDRVRPWAEVSETLPVAVIAFGTPKPHWLATLISPAAEVITENPCDTFPLKLIPVWATSEAPAPVTRPVPVMLPADVKKTSPSLSWASIGALTVILPLPVVTRTMFDVDPALVTPLLATVIPPPALISSMRPKPLLAVVPAVETLLNVTPPPPD